MNAAERGTSLSPTSADGAPFNPKTAADESLLVVDAGGTKTAAWLVDLLRAENDQVIGRGRAPAGNPLSVGFADAARAIRDAVASAHRDAGLARGCASRAILSIAGAANPQLREQFVEWVRSNGLAERVAIVADVLPVLAAGSDDCCGVALIAGTGSVAYGRAHDGRTHLRGGWGYLLGDEGSGYAIGRAALQHTLHSLEISTTHRPLVDAVLSAIGVNKVLELTRAIYGSEHPRVAIAAVAPHVIAFADDGDADAQSIIDDAARDLANLVARTVQSIEPVESPIALAASGGVLLSSKRMQDQLQIALRREGLECEMHLVAEPLAGCIRLAAPDYDGTLVHWQ
jgi:N-acetylglucosamine kinase-like BadF-type ATPase